MLAALMVSSFSRTIGSNRRWPGSFQGGQDHREKRPKALAAHSIRSLPEHHKRPPKNDLVKASPSRSPSLFRNLCRAIEDPDR
jgi:hypothetical protein